jgi:hypothetical protein
MAVGRVLVHGLDSRSSTTQVLNSAWLVLEERRGTVAVLARCIGASRVASRARRCWMDAAWAMHGVDEGAAA